MSLTQYYTATTLDGFIADLDNSLDWLFTRKRDEDGLLNYGEFIADVGAMALGSTTYEWILDHEFADKDPADWKWPYDIPCWVFTHRQLPVGPDSDLLDEVIVSIAPATLGGGAPLLPLRIELRLDELGRNGDFASARYSVVRPT
jgi:dihydrofolate reductase